MARVLVTGANGFLGSAIVAESVRAGHEVTAFVLTGTGRERLGTVDVAVVEGDVTDARSVARAMRGVDYCIHVAGDTSFHRCDLPRLRAVNVAGTGNVARAARAAGVRRLVHTSSVAAIGYDPRGRPVDESAPFNWPAGLPYMETKHAGEQLALSTATASFEVLSLNPATVLGTSASNPSKSGLVAALRAGQVFALPRGATTVCDVTDVARAHVAALTWGRSGQRYIIGGPHVAFRELIPALAEALGTTAPRRLAPRWLPLAGEALGWAEARGLRLATPAGALRLSDLSLCYASDKARAELGYRSRPLPEIVRSTAALG